VKPYMISHRLEVPREGCPTNMDFCWMLTTIKMLSNDVASRMSDPVQKPLGRASRWRTVAKISRPYESKIPKGLAGSE
jgi:hypothetical protein